MKSMQLHTGAKNKKVVAKATSAGKARRKISANKTNVETAVLMPEKLALANRQLKGVQLPAGW